MRLATEADLKWMQDLLDLPENEEGLKGGLDAPIPPASFLLESGPCLRFEDGFFAFVQVANGVLEIHTIFRPNGQFFEKVRKAKQAIGWVFTYEDAEEIVTQVHVENRVALLLTERCGFRPLGSTAERTFHRLRLEDWVIQNPVFSIDGACLRAALGVPCLAAAPFLGYVMHADAAGFGPKAMGLLSRYAILYGIPSLRVESWNPLTLSLNETSVVVNP